VGGLQSANRQSPGPKDAEASIILFYFILFYFILFYFILFYFILFYLKSTDLQAGKVRVGGEDAEGTEPRQLAHVAPPPPEQHSQPLVG
jgi:hypothetical protein